MAEAEGVSESFHRKKRAKLSGTDPNPNPKPAEETFLAMHFPDNTEEENQIKEWGQIIIVNVKIKERDARKKSTFSRLWALEKEEKRGKEEKGRKWGSEIKGKGDDEA